MRYKLLIALVFVAAIFPILFIANLAPRACGSEGTVFVDPSIPNYTIVSNQIESRLVPGDDISVFMQAEGARTPLASSSPIAIRTFGRDEITVDTSGDWPSSVWLTDRVLRVSGITRDPVDRVLRMVREIHVWQAANPKPPPPQPPAPPYDWSWVWWPVGICLGVVLLRIVVGIVRRGNARRAALLERFDHSDPNDLYGMFKPADLGE